jgi:hypothetical protein
MKGRMPLNTVSGVDSPIDSDPSVNTAKPACAENNEPVSLDQICQLDRASSVFAERFYARNPSYEQTGLKGERAKNEAMLSQVCGFQF